MMKFIRTSGFKRAYRKLGPQYRELVKKALTQLMTDRNYPGLRVKRIQGTSGIWELRAGRDIRVTFEIETESYVLRNVGHHDPALKNP